MSFFDTIFQTAVYTALGGVGGVAANSAINLAKGDEHTSAEGILSDLGGEISRQKTTDLALKNTDVLDSVEGDVAAVTASSAVQADERVQTTVNTGYDVAQAVGGVGVAAGVIGGAGTGAAAATTGVGAAPEAGGLAQTGLSTVPSAAVPGITTTAAPATTGVAATTGAAHAAPATSGVDVISGAGAAGPDFTGAKNILTNPHAAQQFGNAASNAGAETISASKVASKSLSAGQKIYNGVNDTAKSFQDPVQPVQSEALSSMPTPPPQIKVGAPTESLTPQTSSFQSIFGPSMGVKGIPDLLSTEPKATPADLASGLTVPQVPAMSPTPSMNYMQPMAPVGATQSDINQGKYVALSDQRHKTNITNADRSIENFLQQIGTHIKW